MLTRGITTLVLDGQLTSEEDLYRQWAKMDLGELVALQGRVELSYGSLTEVLWLNRHPVG
jgi:hypothetical protein